MTAFEASHKPGRPIRSLRSPAGPVVPQTPQKSVDGQITISARPSATTSRETAGRGSEASHSRPGPLQHPTSTVMAVVGQHGVDPVAQQRPQQPVAPGGAAAPAAGAPPAARSTPPAAGPRAAAAPRSRRRPCRSSAAPRRSPAPQRVHQVRWPSPAGMISGRAVPGPSGPQLACSMGSAGPWRKAPAGLTLGLPLRHLGITEKETQ